MTRLRFGIVTAPFHPVPQNPTLALDRDLELVQWLDKLGFDEAWKTHRLQSSYLVSASCQVVTFPEDASPRRKIFAAAFLERAEASIQDLEDRAALREYCDL